AGDDLAEIERFRFEALPAREGEQLVGQLRAAFGRAAHVDETPGQIAVYPRGRDAPLDKFEIAQHDGQQVVEIMRDAGGELTDSLETLHLPQRRLDVFALLDLRQ